MDCSLGRRIRTVTGGYVAMYRALPTVKVEAELILAFSSQASSRVLSCSSCPEHSPILYYIISRDCISM